jgi:ubiquinone/menaquinone biosynthesis C-methylase UbiE
MTDLTASLLNGLQMIARRQPRPRPFVDLGALPWDDPAFSQHFLRTATRSQRHTQREITCLEQWGLLRPGQHILDVACGGGRHSLAMARRGAVVTGMDVGPAAIATARQRARKAGLHVDFVQGDVRHLEYNAAFDAITFIFGCFTEMTREHATEVLQRLSRSLRPGGMFVLDVYAPDFFTALDGEQEWWVGRDFIAGRFPQLVLTEYFYYANDKTYARRDFICDARTGDIHTFGVSGQAYALPELCDMLTEAGMQPAMVYGGWRGEEVTAESPMYIVLAAKR